MAKDSSSKKGSIENKKGRSDKKKKEQFHKLADIPGRSSTKLPLTGNRPQEIVFGNIIFDLEEIKGDIENWYSSHGYSATKRSTKQKVMPLGLKVEISWKASRPADRFAKYHLNLDALMTEVNDIKGAKLLKHGNVEWSVSAVLELDYAHEYAGSSFSKFIGHLYKEYIYSNTLERHKIQLAGAELGSFKAMLKTVTSKYIDK